MRPPDHHLAHLPTCPIRPPSHAGTMRKPSTYRYEDNGLARQTRRHWSGICPTIRPLLTYSGLILCPPNPIWGGFLLTPFFAFCLLRTYCNFGGQGGWLHFCNFLQNQRLRGCQDLCVMRYGGITHKGESGFMRFGAIWCVLVRLGAISCDLISKKKTRELNPFFVFLFLNTPCRKGGWVRARPLQNVSSSRATVTWTSQRNTVFWSFFQHNKAISKLSIFCDHFELLVAGIRHRQAPSAKQHFPFPFYLPFLFLLFLRLTKCPPVELSDHIRHPLQWRCVCGTLGIHFGIHFEFFVFLFSLAAEGGLCGPVRFEQRLSPLSPLFISLFSFIHIHSANTATLYTGKRSREEAQNPISFFRNMLPKPCAFITMSLRNPRFCIHMMMMFIE